MWFAATGNQRIHLPCVVWRRYLYLPPPCQVIKPYRKLLRDIGNLFISTMESRKPMATAKPSKPRPVRVVLFTDVLVLSEPKDGNLILSTEPCSQALLHKVDLAHATINT